MECPHFKPRYLSPCLKTHPGLSVLCDLAGRADLSDPPLDLRENKSCPSSQGGGLYRGVGADQPGLPCWGSQEMWGVRAAGRGADLTVQWLLFPHQGLSSSSWWANWAQRTANTLSAMQSTSEMPQRHRLELCGDTGGRDGCLGLGMEGRTPGTLPTSDEHLHVLANHPGLSTHVNSCGVEGTVGHQCQ